MGCAQGSPVKATTGNGNKPAESPGRKTSEHAMIEVDPRLPLTARELYRLKSSWKAVHRNITVTGVELFVSLFRSNAELMVMFQQLRGMDVSNTDTMRDNEYLSSHGEKVMTVIDETILNLDNLDKALDSLHATAAGHSKFSGFYSKLFLVVEQAFLEAVKVTLADRYSEQIQEIYKKTIQFILNEMMNGYNSVT